MLIIDSIIRYMQFISVTDHIFSIFIDYSIMVLVCYIYFIILWLFVV